MIDPRFYEVSGPLSASDVAALAKSTVLRGDAAASVRSVAAASRAGPGDLVFVEAGAEHGVSARASVVLVASEAAAGVPDGPAVIVCRNPRATFAAVAARLIALRRLERGQAAVHPSARIHPSVELEPGVVIGAGAALGPEVRIGANTVIGPGVQIGARTSIAANASIKCALIGDRVMLFPGVVVGEAGFGLSPGDGGAHLTPHLGRVIIQDGVTIGANSCIDRGFLDDTVIGEGAHIDNLCHVGHNCRIGAHVVMAAFAGISGSSVVGDGAQFGGRVGLKDHVIVGPGARIAAGAAVLSDVPAGETWAGYPAKPIRPWMRELAWLARSAQKRPITKD